MSEAGPADQDRVLANSALMAAGTVVSRLSGFVRSALLAAALGVQLHAELFNIANTIPNMLYILLAGGVFNAVLVPQLVRSMRDDADGGEAYTNRVVTLAALFLAAVTLVLVVAAPLVVDVYLDSGYDQAARSSTEAFARLCLPQVFFYGMFVLVGQILNSRGRFGPMMWAPIANNVVAVGTLVVYLVVFGPASKAEQLGPYTTGQELLLGLGSTLGIALQLAILVPYLRAAGFTFRPRFDFRGTGLGHTLRLGTWTVLFVIVNQIALAVVVRLASSGVADGAGTGSTVYSFAFLVVMVPHSVVTVSLATAILPQLSARAAAEDVRGLARLLSGTLRNALAVIVPFVALLPLVAPGVAALLLHGAAADDADLYVPTLTLFGPGVLLFTVHYLLLRGFYALEETRTVFWNQCWVAATNIGLAIVLVRATDDEHTAPALTVAYAASYLVGAVLSYVVLRRRVGGLDGARLVRFLVRLLLAVLLSTGVAGGVAWGWHELAGPDAWWVVTVLGAAVVTTVDLLVFAAAAHAMRLEEVTSVIRAVTRRVPAPGRR